MTHQIKLANIASMAKARWTFVPGDESGSPFDMKPVGSVVFNQQTGTFRLGPHATIIDPADAVRKRLQPYCGILPYWIRQRLRYRTGEKHIAVRETWLKWEPRADANAKEAVFNRYFLEIEAFLAAFNDEYGPDATEADVDPDIFRMEPDEIWNGTAPVAKLERARHFVGEICATSRMGELKLDLDGDRISAKAAPVVLFETALGEVIKEYESGQNVRDRVESKASPADSR